MGFAGTGGASEKDIVTGEHDFEGEELVHRGIIAGGL